MASASARAAGAKAPGTSTRGTAASRRLFYTHISDQYAPFSTRVVNVGVRDSTYVLDGLLYHESDLRIEEHYTDTAGFTDHVFALMHLLGFASRHASATSAKPNCTCRRACRPTRRCAR